MKAIITPCNGIQPIDIYGGKAYWISWLIANGYITPKSVFISCLNKHEAGLHIKNQLFIDTLSGYIDLSCKFSIRSSGKNEDHFMESKAGNYKTFLNVKGIDNILNKYLEVVRSANDTNEEIGVVIQPMVDAKISGVIFSSDPTTGSKMNISLDYKYGLGENLLNGTSYGKSVSFTVDDKNIHCVSDISDTPFFIDIARIAKEIENKLNLPVDIEWCINQENKLILLQCRPITTIFSNLNKIFKVNSQIKNIIPNRYIESDKIKLRFIAEEYGIHISDAYLLVCDLKEDRLPLDEDEIDISKSEYYKSYNVVILFPHKIDGKIVREFLGKNENINTSITCWRFALRSMPKYKNLKDCLNEYYFQIKKHYWSCSIIIQEIYTPTYTGIIKKINDNFIIEIAKGHFVAKGNIPTSSYTLDKNGNTITLNEIIQDKWIEIVEGYIIDRIATPNEKTSINSDIQKKIIKQFTPLFEKESNCIEFGLLSSESETIPYLIDYVSDEKDKGIEIDSVEKGIISSGKITGKLSKLELVSHEEALHIHFHSSQTHNEYKDLDPTIFYAELPSIEYINILNSYNNKNIGFVFNGGSYLCHLSVLLREKNIPAIILRNKIELYENTLYTIDTNKNEIIKQCS
jgi:hypothetical protein